MLLSTSQRKRDETRRTGYTTLHRTLIASISFIQKVFKISYTVSVVFNKTRSCGDVLQDCESLIKMHQETVPLEILNENKAYQKL